MKNLIREIFRKFGLQINRFSPEKNERNSVTLKPDNGYKGNVLLSYIIEPFLLEDGESVSNAHTHDWESLQIGKTFLNLGYVVDVIDYRDRTFVPLKNYSFFVAARTNFQRIAQLINKDCIKILHLETSHWLFNNSASYKRCLELQQRRGVSLKSFKWVEPNWAIEYADYVTYKGNGFTFSTYSYAGKPSFRTSNPACALYSSPENKDYETHKQNFLWFGSEGLVHKGLDLVLEAFAEMPDYNLTVCGPIDKEKDFEKAYYKEIYQTPNIHTVGWVDISSSKFIEITNKCVGLIYPSCAEGQAGSVINCLQTGLIPILSYESGVDVHDFGLILKDCSIDEIKKSVKKISNLSAEEKRLMAHKAWEYTRLNHSKENFQKNIVKLLKKFL